MKIIATAETFPHEDLWVEYEIYRHGTRYRIQEQECGLGWGILCDAEKPTRRWGTADEVIEILTMDTRDVGVVDIIDEDEYTKLRSLEKY
ncbi:MAG: hypothetical protein SWO11_17010 [Thermodesulfobacteriota bacterium]|nr:hypothetical protein [Thermodesulfobacteriota bacterium]